MLPCLGPSVPIFELLALQVYIGLNRTLNHLGQDFAMMFELAQRPYNKCFVLNISLGFRRSIGFRVLRSSTPPFTVTVVRGILIRGDFNSLDLLWFELLYHYGLLDPKIPY